MNKLWFHKNATDSRYISRKNISEMIFSIISPLEDIYIYYLLTTVTSRGET